MALPMCLPVCLGRLSELGQPALPYRGDVARRKDIGETLCPEPVIDEYAPAGALREAPRVHRLGHSHAGSPQDDGGLEEGFVPAADGGDEGAVLAHFLDRGPEHQLDAAPFKRPFRVLGRLGVERPEQAVGHVDEDNLDPVRPDFRKKHGNVFVPHFRERTGGLHAGGPAADDGHSDLRARAFGRGVEEPLNSIAHVECVPAGVERQRVLLRAGNPEIVGGHAGRHNEVVVRDGVRAVDRDRLGRMVHGGDLAELYPQVLLPRLDRTQIVGDVPGVQGGGGHLIEKRLEGRVRILVDERDADLRLLEAARRGNSGETASDDDDAGSVRAIGFAFRGGRML